MFEPIRNLRDKRIYENSFLGDRMDLFFRQIEEGGEYAGFKEVYGIALAVGLNRILKSDGNLDTIKNEEDFMKLLPPKSSGISFRCREDLQRKGGYSYKDLLEKRF